MRLLHSFLKEARLLARDLGALALLFIMPTALVVIVTLVQEGGLRSLHGAPIEIVWSTATAATWPCACATGCGGRRASRWSSGGTGA